jgi:hypothetical protein
MTFTGLWRPANGVGRSLFGKIVMNNNSESQTDLTSIFGEVISSYTRAQALADGFLVDVSETAREAGFRFPVALTAALWSVVETIPKAHSYQDVQGRLWDVLYMASLGVRRARGGSRIAFELILHREGTRKKFVTLYCDCGPGDDAEPVITIGFPEDF